MGYIRPWAFWRRVQYGSGLTAVILFLATGVYYGYIYAAPSCFDGRQSGDQTGVDCGGSCTRICAQEVTPPAIEWVDSFEIAPNQYNAVAYIQNPNPDAGTPELDYTFRFYNENDELITERSGQSPLLPNGTYALFEGRIDMFNREPARTEIVLEPAELWLPVTRRLQEQLVTRDFELQDTDTSPRLNATLENTSLEEISQADVTATIFDAGGNPLTASQTFVAQFGPRSTESVIFTWPNSIARTVRSCMVPSDIMTIIDRSGSMAADGGDPPEPLESTKRAAEQFVAQTRDEDQVGYLSYATEPSDPIDQPLTSNKSAVQSAIAETTIGTDGIQYTNTGDAFQVAGAELRGSRARSDSRKVIVFLTDGDVTRPVNPETGERDVDYARQYALDNAQELKDNNVTIYTIAFGDFFLEIEDVLDRDLGLVEDLASDPEKSFVAPTIEELEKVYTDIAEDICEDGPARVDIIPNSADNFAPLR